MVIFIKLRWNDRKHILMFLVNLILTVNGQPSILFTSMHHQERIDGYATPFFTHLMVGSPASVHQVGSRPAPVVRSAAVTNHRNSPWTPGPAVALRREDGAHGPSQEEPGAVLAALLARWPTVEHRP